jgi:hypothetical protein
MLRSLKDLAGYTVNASDGAVGNVVDFLLDDERWTVRYLVVETGAFFDQRRVLISPISFRTADWATREFHLALTIDKIQKSPSVDTDKPVSRQHEVDYYRYGLLPGVSRGPKVGGGLVPLRRQGRGLGRRAPA